MHFGNLGPLGHFHNIAMERSRPMSEFLVSRDQFLNLYLTFEIKLNILFLSFFNNLIFFMFISFPAILLVKTFCS